MEYQALYRQFRPEVFGDMYGQDAIVTALENQVETGKLAHAYLFCGTRGTGKTSTARILARAVNCENPNGAEPCNECASCKSILSGSAIDVVEIDAASNTGVENIREIREEVSYPPAMLKYKVYIIDEVHMLSVGAFNALLKTLEEPPEHVIFILATTEYHKVPATIISRCQRFDFKRIGSEVISERIKYVCSSIGATLDDEALQVISYAADGSMRDGLAILDKCLSYGNGAVTGEVATKILGIVDDSVLFSMSEAIARRNVGELIEKVEKAIRDGRDPVLLTVYLIEHFRCIMVASLVKSPMEVLQMSKEKTQRFEEQAKLFTTKELISIVRALSNLYKTQKEAPNPKVMLEIGLASICSPAEEVRAIKAAPSIAVPPPPPPPPEAEFVPEPAEVPEKIIEDASVSAVSDVGSGAISSGWSKVMDKILKDGKMMIYSNLLLGKPADVNSGVNVEFTPDKKGNYDLLNKHENIEYLEKVILDALNVIARVRFVMGNENAEDLKQEDFSAIDLAKKFPGLVQVDDDSQ